MSGGGASAAACRLLTATQHYGPGFGFHTWLSGRVDRLEALYAVVADGDGMAGVGEVRLNAAYLHGHDGAAVAAAAADAVARLPWADGAAAALDAFDRAHPAEGIHLPVRMVLELAVRDLAARRAGGPVAALFGGPAAAAPLATNQSLAWTEARADLLAVAERMVTRGFTRLKVRLGLAGVAEDRARLLALRDRFGEAVELAADLNGAWPASAVDDGLVGVAEAAPVYVEQPCRADDWATIGRLAAAAPVPLMLDETAASPAAVDRLIGLGWRHLVHLKLIKMGGLDRLIAAARRCRDAGIGVMVGQMNEGAVATAAAVAAAQVLAPRHAELYGADGLIDDPGSGVVYGDGTVCVTGATGLGVAFDETRCRPVPSTARTTLDVG